MKILLLADKMESGGAETHIQTLARGLLKAGHTVGLFSTGGKLADALAAEGVRCRAVPKIGRNPFAFLAARRILRKEVCKNGYEILHAHTRMTALLANKICNPYMRKSEKTPGLVVTAHAKFRANWLYRRLSVWGEETIAVSEDLRAFLADRYNLPVEKITVIPNGIDETRFFPARTNTQPLGAKGVLAGKPLQILFVSRLDADCSLGADLLCRAAVRLSDKTCGIPPFSVTIAGRGSEFFRLCALANACNSLAGREDLRVVKPKNEGDLISLYQAADLFVGVSRAALEASFCGCPVLLCGNEGYGGLFSPDRLDLAASNLTCRGEPLPTEDKLCRDLAELIKNPTHLLANAERTTAWVRANFSASAALRATEEVYERLLWRKRKSGAANKQKDRVVIGGYAGCGNLGDDAILEGLLAGLWQRGISPDSIVVLSGRPRRDSKRFGVRCAGRKNPFAILFALWRADVFVSGGGTLLQNRTGKCSLFYYLALLRLARLLGCRMVVFGGIGEVAGAVSRKLVKKELERCAAILLRDEISARFARVLGLPAAKPTVGADAAFLLPDPPPFRAAFLCGRLIGDLYRPFLCVCPCGAVDVSGISALLRRSFPGFFPLFLLCDPARDASAARALRKEFGGIVCIPRDVSEAMALFGAAALVISSRLHPLILSVRMGTRCVCFSGGDPKLSAFCRRANLPLFPATGTESFPCAASFFASPAPTCNDFCRNAAKDLANLCEIVYNGREESFPARARGKRRTFDEKRATGGPAPPDHH